MQLALNDKRLDVAFTISLVLTIVSPALLPHLALSFFPPFLIIACYKKPLSVCLWLALCCGLILDLLSSQTRLGLYPLSFCIVLVLLYNQKRNFFADSPTTLPIMTFLFSSLTAWVAIFLMYVIEIKSLFSWHWALTDTVLMPAWDALYAFCMFILPALLFGKRRRRGKDYFLET